TERGVQPAVPAPVRRVGAREPGGHRGVPRSRTVRHLPGGGALLRVIEARTKAEARGAIAAARARGGGPVALVPTMGALHEAHLSLVDRARERAGFIVLSVYVNPLQFGPAEDLARYPRDLGRDAGLAAERGVDLLFAPTDAEMYPAGEPVVRVSPGPLGDRLCGAFRPGHFEGVLTVVAKLFNIVGPDVAVFGQKDYQQAV